MKKLPYILIGVLVIWFVSRMSDDWKQSDAYQQGWQDETERVSGMIEAFRTAEGRYPATLSELLPDFYTPSDLFPSEEGKHLEYFNYRVTSNRFALQSPE